MKNCWDPQNIERKNYFISPLLGSATSDSPLSGKICLKGHHGKYVGATPKQTATCSSPNGGPEETVEIVVISTDTVALKSSFGKFLSGWCLL